MAVWSTEVLAVDKGVNGFAVEVLVSNDEGFKQSNIFNVRSIAELKSTIRAFIASVTPINTEQIPVGPLDLKPPDPIVIPPNQEELDRAAFFSDYNKERTDQALATLTPALAARYKPEYGALR